jgi:transglutaminase-like putative cysteine protease
MKRLRAPLAVAVATLLTMTALTSVFATLGWWPPAAGVVVLLVAAATAVRRASSSRLLPTGVAAAAGTCYVTALFAPGDAYAAVVPSVATFGQFGTLAADGFADIHELVTPVPTHQGLLLLTVVGVGIVTLTADLVATGLRRPALAGLPLLALYVVPSATVPHGVGLLAFVVSALGFLVLLGTDTRERLTRWGRSLRAAPRRAGAGTAVLPSPTGAAARRVGVAAIAVALVIPALLPSLTPRLGHNGSGPGAGDGHGSVTTYNPFVAIKAQLNNPDPVRLLRYRVSGPHPGYLRMTTLDRFSGQAWTSSPIGSDSDSPVSDGLPTRLLAGDSSDRRSTTHITVGRLDVSWLPVPFPTVGVNVDGDWRYDQMSSTVFSTEQTSKGRSYDAVALAGRPSPRRLARATEDTGSKRYQHYTKLPTLPDSIHRLTERVTGGAHTPFAKARALQHFFRSPPFRYDQTSVPNSNGTNALVRFLFVTHRGFCEQYAAAMATMARVAGIPARVAVGFTAGEHRPDGGYLVTSHDAHAWPELYFSGVGWLRFEPTPTQAAGGTAVRPSYAPGPGAPHQPSASGGSHAHHSAGGIASARQRSLIRKGSDTGLSEIGASAATRTRREPGNPWPWVALGLALTALLLAVPSAGRVALRRVRRREVVGSASAQRRTACAWAQLRDDARDAGMAWRSADTPRRFVARVGAEAKLPDGAAAALRRLARAEERARYAAEAPPASAAVLLDDVAAVRSALLAGLGRTGRLRARALPPSMLARLSRAGGLVADALDAADRLLVRAQAWLRNRLRTAAP